eukprot:CAMPEP_0194342838 /NCGR_PEP_ID=MMETSP0171-20130528/94174_1 /TAXON_ID=218684 /ORGANISM="Corethron pennatum, Strain L29A3" /LENGTH=72 /DNA_ID=CAMNT_0039108753 /DNA_START=47 /DNA_END=262 /DNA_ORIENTATION=+
MTYPLLEIKLMYTQHYSLRPLRHSRFSYTQRVQLDAVKVISRDTSPDSVLSPADFPADVLDAASVSVLSSVD